jgi:hypothetical protein
LKLFETINWLEKLSPLSNELFASASMLERDVIALIRQDGIEGEFAFS